METEGEPSDSLNGKHKGKTTEGAATDRVDVAASDETETQEDPRTPTRASSKFSKLPLEGANGKLEEEQASTASALPLPVLQILSQERDELEAARPSAGNVSGASSPDVDSDRPLSKKTMIPLSRGDSTSSDSSVSGLSRASSSSSVYATPFRMTPFRTPAGTGRTGSVAGTGSGERSSYFQTSSPSRFGTHGIRSGNSASFSGPVRIHPQSTVHFDTAHNVYIPGADAAKAVDQVEALVAGDSGISENRPSNTITAIGPTPAAAYAAESNKGSPKKHLLSLPNGSDVTTAISGNSDMSPASRPPPSPHLDQMLSTSFPGGLRPLRPALGSRTASNASIGVNMHKRAADFDLGEVLGEGSYSTVFLATDKFPPHKQYALKVLDKKHIIKERKVKYVNVEKDTLARLDRHPGIVRLYWTFHDERSLYFVLELASSGEILKYIKDYGSFDVICARFYAAQLVSALEHMHTKGVIHRDIKPENILLDAKMRMKITDFGTAKLLSSNPSSDTGPSAADELHSRSNSFVGTAQYVSPELLTAKPVSEAQKDLQAAPQPVPPPACADFWAFGCVVYQFITGRTPFRAPNEYLIFQKITSLDYDFPPNFPIDARDLVQKLLVLDPFERLGAKNGVEDIKAHPFFKSIDWNTIWLVDPPELKTGATPPMPFSKQVLALEETSLHDDASVEDMDDDAEEVSLSSPLDENRGSTDKSGHTRAQSRSDAPPLPDMLPAQASARPANGTRPPLSKNDTGSYRSSLSSGGGGSLQETSGSSGSLQGHQTSHMHLQEPTQPQRTRSRSGSNSGRWSKLINMPRNALQRVKIPRKP